MPGFRDIIGHEEIIAHLKGAIRTERVSHAYILDGAPQAGKKMLAEAFALSLLCEQRDENTGDACGQCPVCKKILGRNHPDILYVQHEKPNTISVGDVREQIGDTAAIRPYSSRYKIYIMDEAEKMNVQAQNALLKTLEEPPYYVVILLLTTNADSFLPTIRSRCVTLRLRTIREDKIIRFLTERYQVPPSEAEKYAAFAMGNAGRAVYLAESQEFHALCRILTGQMRRIGETRDGDLASFVEELADYKDYTGDYLDLLLFWFRDAAVCKYAEESVRLLFAEEEKELYAQAKRLDDAGLSGIFASIEKARRRIAANVNRELTLELLLLDIKGALTARRRI